MKTVALWDLDQCHIAVKQHSFSIFIIELGGHITAREVTDLLLPVLEGQLSSPDKKISLLYDLRRLQTYELGIVTAHGAFSLKHLGRIDRIAGVTLQTSHRFGIAAVNMLQPITVRIFEDIEASLEWLAVVLN